MKNKDYISYKDIFQGQTLYIQLFKSQILHRWGYYRYTGGDMSFISFVKLGFKQFVKSQKERIITDMIEEDVKRDKNDLINKYNNQYNYDCSEIIKNILAKRQ
jgi:hypothetical protein